MIRRRQAVIPRIATASVTEQVQVLRGNRKFCLHHESAMWAASSACELSDQNYQMKFFLHTATHALRRLGTAR
ncbi:hypothetical protein HBI56_048400 [Parastagonospora nodorum]|uniref:Uncharacterized protein n=1 Tax=Phaeosphaeria nodorum (strain SN15 / ATCC MYA-4574 / FGSC 10173) TaxID=321614 RepID=A0A7U2ESH0_PHANO|nr:hypothetical protein HBH56_061330 [Parastagonospora nodorum]QRC91967.1 hypothetical protein JI435_021360 [Parastagonospora nodorum SN15]KAH3930787.1 hypothetical protein HBH54_105270 [Parastagonospora nodorum]KAH3954083.1 hypothetical protein HBH53_019950 [Parastagonospora nodorum]KAH3968280.1 hypothetical protein HBH51_133510 [Parastagonospora nodorum]